MKLTGYEFTDIRPDPVRGYVDGTVEMRFSTPFPDEVMDVETIVRVRTRITHADSRSFSELECRFLDQVGIALEQALQCLALENGSELRKYAEANLAEHNGVHTQTGGF